MLIDLDLTGDPPAERGTPPAHRRRWLGFALSALLVLTLAGAMPTLGPHWLPAGTAPVTAAGSVFAIAGDRLYTAVPGERTVTAWALRPFRQLWSVAIPAAVIDVVHLQPVPQRLLLTVSGGNNGMSTIALDDRTGALAWTAPQPMEPLPGGHLGLVYRYGFDGKDSYEAERVRSGEVSWTPPTHTFLVAVNLIDGRDRWSRQWRGSAVGATGETSPASVAIVSPERTGATLSTGKRRLELLDVDTGSTLRQRVADIRADPELSSLPGGGVNAQLTDGLLVLKGIAGGTPMSLAFGLADLTEKWRLSHRTDDNPVSSCAGTPCVLSYETSSILDPATGAISWTTAASTGINRRGGHILLSERTDSDDADSTDEPAVPMRTVDIATGAPHVDLGAWPLLVEGMPDTPIVLAAPDDRGGTVFGLLAAGESVVRVLGNVASPVSYCSAAARLIACRTEAGLAVIEYRA